MDNVIRAAAKDAKVGLATYRAIAAMFEDAPLAAYDAHVTPAEAVAFLAQAAFLDSARVTPWKAYFALPDAASCAVLADEFRHLGTTPALLDFEATKRNDAVRFAFINLAVQLEAAAAQ